MLHSSRRPIFRSSMFFFVRWILHVLPLANHLPIFRTFLTFRNRSKFRMLVLRINANNSGLIITLHGICEFFLNSGMRHFCVESWNLIPFRILFPTPHPFKTCSAIFLWDFYRARRDFYLFIFICPLFVLKWHANLIRRSYWIASQRCCC